MAIPVTLEDARRQIRLEVDDTSRDADLVTYIYDAAAWVEDYTGHLLDRREVTQAAYGVATVFLRAWPVASGSTITAAYVDANGDLVPALGGRLDARKRPARFLPPRTGTPFCGDFTYEVTVVAGYARPADVPPNIKRAMLVLIAAYDADREGGELLKAAIKTAEGLCQRLRLRRL